MTFDPIMGAMVDTFETADNPFYSFALDGSDSGGVFVATVQSVADPAYRDGMAWAAAIDFAVIAVLKDLDPDAVLALARSIKAKGTYDNDRVDWVLSQVNPRHFVITPEEELREGRKDGGKEVLEP